ncbi:hypothetical protein K439DRAFT_1614887 [Ramaria rubella]|nr:hypothetical protein K439DRAFT_1614887 [Ramaria rubella]
MNVPLVHPLNPLEPQQWSMDDLPAEQSKAEPTSKNGAGRKVCAKFTYSDIDKLLNAVLHIDPVMCKHTQSKEKWQEVLRMVQDNGSCLGCDWETVWNKLKSVLKLIGMPNAKAAFPQSTLGRELNSDPLKFAVLSEHIDAVAAMKRHVEQVLDEECEQVKEAQDAKAVHGHAIHNTMLMGHACKSKHPWDDLPDSDGSEKENLPPASNPIHLQTTTLSQMSLRRRIQPLGIDVQNVASEVLIEEHHWANEEAHLGHEKVKAMRDELRLSGEAQERAAISHS